MSNMRLREENMGCRKKFIHFKVVRVMRANPPRPALGPREGWVMRDGPMQASGLK